MMNSPFSKYFTELVHIETISPENNENKGKKFVKIYLEHGINNL